MVDFEVNFGSFSAKKLTKILRHRYFMLKIYKFEKHAGSTLFSQYQRWPRELNKEIDVLIATLKNKMSLLHLFLQ